MKIGILAAMDKEVKLLLPLMNDVKEVVVNNENAYEGNIHRHRVLLMKCGIGKVNSALNTFRMIQYFDPDLILNSGVAGGADPSMKVGSVLVATEAAYHDVWCGPGTRWGELPGMPPRFPMCAGVLDCCSAMKPAEELRFGLIATGDRFVTSVDDLDHIKNLYPDALACDMESASIAHACYECSVPFAVIRVVSDTPGQDDNISQYENFWTDVPVKTFGVVKSLLEAI